MASLETFATITRNVVADGEFVEFLPTVLYPERRQLAALEGIPAGADTESIAVEWATEGALGKEEFLVAFRVSDSEFKIVRRFAEGFEAGIFNVKPNEISD